MREFMSLVESATERAFYIHVTPSENLSSIRAKGLVPNHNGGNYEDMRWASLNGVYASKYAKQLADYLNAHEMVDFLLCVVEVDMDAALPDEDTIDIIFDHLFEKMIKSAGLSIRSPEISDMYPGEERYVATVDQLAKGFHTLAAGKYHIDMDHEMIHDAADIWLAMKLGVDEEGEMIWGDTKDRIVHAYPKMQHPELGTRHSVRIPSVVGFEGPTRIVAIIRLNDDEAPEVLYNTVPPEAKEEVNKLVDAVIYA